MLLCLKSKTAMCISPVCSVAAIDWGTSAYTRKQCETGPTITYPAPRHTCTSKHNAGSLEVPHTRKGVPSTNLPIHTNLSHDSGDGAYNHAHTKGATDTVQCVHSSTLIRTRFYTTSAARTWAMILGVMEPCAWPPKHVYTPRTLQHKG